MFMGEADFNILQDRQLLATHGKWRALCHGQEWTTPGALLVQTCGAFWVLFACATRVNLAQFGRDGGLHRARDVILKMDNPQCGVCCQIRHTGHGFKCDTSEVLKESLARL